MTVCQRCGKNPATLHLTRLVGGQRQELHLCLECAQGTNQSQHKIHLIDLMKTMLSMEQEAAPRPEPGGAAAVQPRCPGCGFTLDDIRRTGRMGCARCYTTFREQVEPVLLRVQGKSTRPAKQEGMAPTEPAAQPAAPDGEQDDRVQRLRGEMQQAVAREEYERAAQIRDEIKALEGRG